MEVIATLEKLEPILGVQTRQMEQLCLLAEGRRKQILELGIQNLARKHLGQNFDSREQILLKPPIHHEVQGELPWGIARYSRFSTGRFGLTRKALSEHVGILGQSGSGKTNTAMIMFRNFWSENMNFLVLDPKGTWRSLINWSSVNRELRVFTVGSRISPLNWNPFIPPEGMEWEVWMLKLADIFCLPYYLGHGGWTLFTKASRHLYEEWEADSSDVPSFQKMKEYLHTAPLTRKELEWLGPMDRALDRVTLGPFGEGLNAEISIPLRQLVTSPNVLEMDNLADDDILFFCQALQSHVYHHLKSLGPAPSVRLMMVVEEWHRFSKTEAFNQGLRMGREYGEGLMYMDQTPSEVENVTLGNAGTKISMKLSTSPDIQRMGGAMDLVSQDRHFINNLETGYGIVSMKDGFTQPFLVQFPKVPDLKIVSDEELKQRMARFHKPASIYDSTLLLWPEHQVSSRAPKAICTITYSEAGKQVSPNPPGKSCGGNPDTPERVLDLLADALAYPGSPMKDRRDRLQVSWRALNAAKVEGVELGLLNAVRVPTRRGQVVVLEATKKGVLARPPSSPAPNPLHGGAVHQFYKQEIKKQLEKKGYTVTLEKELEPDFPVDVVASRGNEKVACEVETMLGSSSKERLVEHVNRLNGLDYQVRVYPTSAAAKRHVKAVLGEIGAENLACAL